MSKRILVVGLQPNDAGKTTLCKALIHGFKETGVTLVPFKPHSGTGYWSQFDVFQRNLLNGSLLSSDIMDLEAAATNQVTE
jgi:predicted P-loop ATPase/GTPase